MAMKRIRIGLLSLVFLAAPFSAFALTDAGNASLIQSLLAQVEALQRQIAALIAAKGVTTGPVIARTLSFGIKGDDVTELQKFLISQGALTPDSATGYFGRLTEAAVRQFQSTHGLETVGIVGPKTRALLERFSPGGNSGGGEGRPIITPPPSAQSCVWNGGILPSGQSVTAYQSSSVPFGQSCTSQTRTCANGTLSGTYAYGECSVQQGDQTAPTVANSAPAVVVTLAGTPHVAIPDSAFHQNTLPGKFFDANDVPPRAYRDASGLIHFFGNNSVNFAFTGTSFEPGALHQSTKTMYRYPLFDGDPSKFRYKEWIMPPYAISGNYIYALIHNELHAQAINPSDPFYYLRVACEKNNPNASGQFCYYTSAQSGESRNGGFTFTSPAAPDNFLFGIPYKFDTKMGRVGIGVDTMIKNPNDGYYYALLWAFAYKDQKQGTCVARSVNLSTWNFWTGKDWSGTFANPYTNQMTDEQAKTHTCVPVTGMTPATRGMLYSVIYDEKHHVFVAVIRSGITDPETDSSISAFSYITSPDLVHWSDAVQFFTQLDDNKSGLPIAYGSFIDTESAAPNFDVTDGSLYFYYVKWPSGLNDGKNRDVMRVRVRFSVPADTVPPPVPTDTVPPTVALTAPSAGSTLSDTATLTAAASDNVGVAGVVFKVDGAVIGAEDTAAPYTVAWNTKLVSNGSHTLSAVARDAAGNFTTNTVQVTVSNSSPTDTVPPTVSVSAPAGSATGATVSGVVTVWVAASDDVGVSNVRIRIGGTAVDSIITSAPYSLRWNTTLTPNRMYTINAVARDDAGNVSSTSQDVTVSNP